MPPHAWLFKLWNFATSNFQTFKISNFRARNSADFRTFNLDAFQTFKLCKLSIFRTLKLSNSQTFDLWNFQTFELETFRSLKPSNSQTRGPQLLAAERIWSSNFELSNFRTFKSSNIRTFELFKDWNSRTFEFANFQGLKLSNFEGRSNSAVAKVFKFEIEAASRARKFEGFWNFRVWKVRSLTPAACAYQGAQTFELQRFSKLQTFKVWNFQTSTFKTFKTFECERPRSGHHSESLVVLPYQDLLCENPWGRGPRNCKHGDMEE